MPWTGTVFIIFFCWGQALDVFAADLKENYLHAIISGFSVGDTPGVGTFYDFHRRLWLSPDKNLSNPVHPPKEKPQEPKVK